ncbi:MULTISPECIES: molecular chaperone [unclassified Pseudomonas]|nr:MULTISPECIES: fimbria/pilus periplasmic chaperone [unclassified Pseudomonas]
MLARCAFALVLSAPWLCGNVWANVVVVGTRVIYPATEKEIAVRLENSGNEASLVQMWADKGNDQLKADNADAPFLIVPPITRIEPGKGQSMRLIFTQVPVPGDRESVYWLNVLDVPPLAKDRENYMQVAFRTRLKIFLRPAGLAGEPEDAPRAVTWALVKGQAGMALRATNPSAYYVSFNDVAAVTPTATFKGPAGMIPPKGTAEFAIEGLPAQLPAGSSVRLSWVNDFGAVYPVTRPL